MSKKVEEFFQKLFLYGADIDNFINVITIIKMTTLILKKKLPRMRVITVAWMAQVCRS
jgi:hypothetical protein